MRRLVHLFIFFGVLLLNEVPLIANQNAHPSKVFHYYSTAADERHFGMLMQLIGSIHKNDFEHLDEIAVFDLGLTQEQKDELLTIEKTKVYPIEQVHPDICKYVQTDASGRSVRGSFAWKPVVMKASLEMFPYFLYLDSGTLILRSPDTLFKHIQETGYYLMQIPFPIEERITKPVVEKVLSKFSQEKQKVLLQPNSFMIDAGFQGVSRKLYESYVLPVYQLASDLTLFTDDGSARLGFGAARHDQTLFSIFANAEKLTFNSQGWTDLTVDGKACPFHIHWDRQEITDKTTIYRSRADYHFGGDKTAYIHRVKGRFIILLYTEGPPEQLFKTLDAYYQMLSNEVPYHILVSCRANDLSMSCAETKKQAEQYPNLTLRFTDCTSKPEAYNQALEGFGKKFDFVLVADDTLIPALPQFDKAILQEMQKNFADYDGVLHFLLDKKRAVNAAPIVGRKYYERFGYLFQPLYQTSMYDKEFTCVSRILSKEMMVKQTIFTYRDENNRGQIQKEDEVLFNERRKSTFALDDKLLTTLFPKKWSILICTLDERSEQFNGLYGKLSKQIQEVGLADDIEILSFKDNKEHTIGFKRNELVRQAKGRYINFIDDDDDVHDHYIQMMTEKLKNMPDCISLVGIITFNGQAPATFIHSLRYNHYFQENGTYFRPPNHLNTIKRQVASQFLFPDSSYGEDTDWAMQIAKEGEGLLLTEESISSPYYFYKYVDK